MIFFFKELVYMEMNRTFSTFFFFSKSENSLISHAAGPVGKCSVWLTNICENLVSKKK